ncbi:MAG: LysM peptidoglycan-binding domain-containing protein [Treponema sp.]|nr:LysM peptidoglycan-binding domain-containing protein [Treponema sp.]
MNAAEGTVAAAAGPAAVPAPAVPAETPSRPLRQNEYARPAGLGPPPDSPAVPPAPAIGGLDKTLTRHYIAQYSSPGGIAWLNGIIRRGSPYIPFIREEIAKRGLPPELLYLPVIESGYNPRAVSRSGAAGLWQFMKNSMAPFGMTVTNWMDERMDFWKSTQGALGKLEENYRHFGDWALALAAYNAGLGGVNQVIKRTGLRDYWTLCEKKELRTETVQYVPKLIAVAHIMSNPRRFGVDLWPQAPEWTRISPGRMADLSLLEELAGIDRGLLETANPELYHQIIPPDPSYQLKVPAEAAPAILALLEQRDLKLVNHYMYTIRSGDTLSALAQHYGVTAALIQEANPGLRPQFLRIGQEIRIPALKETAPYQKTKNPAAAPAFEGSHLVKRGETLWSIALAYEIDPEELAEANNMALNDTLREGRTLKTPILIK